MGSRELIDVVLVKNDKPYGQVVADQQCITEGVVASALFDKAFLQPGKRPNFILCGINYLKSVRLVLLRAQA